MLVDYERAWLDLKAVIAIKSHHGQRDLLAEMSRLEVARQLDEGLPERALRLYGLVFSDDLIRPPSLERCDVPVDGHNGRVRRDDSINEEQYHGVPRSARATAAG